MPASSVARRPAATAEEALIRAILDGTYAPHTALPGERELALQLGITRPTLREVLRRLERDGWLTVRQGKATRVNDFWREGGLNVLDALARCSEELPADFVAHLLEVRQALGPAYAHDAVRHAAHEVAAYLEDAAALPDTAAAYAAFDWGLHLGLTVASGNPVYTLILNGFAALYGQMAVLYFSRPEARASSRSFYQALLAAARHRDAITARKATLRVMTESIALWNGVGAAHGGKRDT